MILSSRMNNMRINLIFNLQILLKFSQKYAKKIRMTKKFHHIEIEMIRDGDICEIQLSNFGKIINKNDEIYDICKFGYSNMVINDEVVLIIAFIRNLNSNEEEILDVSSWRGTIKVRKIANSTKEELILPSLSDYLILRIQVIFNIKNINNKDN